MASPRKRKIAKLLRREYSDAMEEYDEMKEKLEEKVEQVEEMEGKLDQAEKKLDEVEDQDVDLGDYFTKAELKLVLEDRDEDASGLKDDLVERVKESA